MGLSELSVISWVSAVEGCPLSGAPLYTFSAVDLLLFTVTYPYTSLPSLRLSPGECQWRCYSPRPPNWSQWLPYPGHPPPCPLPEGWVQGSGCPLHRWGNGHCSVCGETLGKLDVSISTCNNAEMLWFCNNDDVISV